MPVTLFENGDGCGDFRIPWADVELQPINTLTNLAFVVAGFSLALRAHFAEVRCNGVLLLAVAWFSALYHATSSWGGFLLDIAAMAVWAGHLIFLCHKAAFALTHSSYCWSGDAASHDGHGSCHPTTRISRTPSFRSRMAESCDVGMATLIVSLCSLALTGPFFVFEVFGRAATQAWDVWANSFLVLILVAVLAPLHLLYKQGMLDRFRLRVSAAIGIIIIGVIFTQLIHIVCVPGHFTAFPLHSVWHFCAASSAWLTANIVDDVLYVCASKDA